MVRTQFKDTAAFPGIEVLYVAEQQGLHFADCQLYPPLSTQDVVQ